MIFGATSVPHGLGLAPSVPPRPLVLVIDDDPTLRFLAREALELDGFAVAEARDGELGLEGLEGVRPDVILLDVNLPGADGFEVCAAIRRMPGGAAIPVLMMTGPDDVDAIHRAYEVGATDFLTKPISWVHLRYRLRYVLRASRAFEQVAVEQARLARAQQIARLGHWELDLDTQMVNWSPEACRIFGLPSGSTQTDVDALWRAVHPDDRAAVASALDAVVAGQAAEDLDYRLALPDGGERTVHQHVEFTQDYQSRPRRLVSTVQDITEREHLQAQLRQAQKMEAVGRLAGGVAHDFNNLLCVIMGRGLLLTNKPDDSAAILRHAEEITRAAEMATSLTRQLLAFSRRQVLQPKVLDLNAVVSGMGTMIQRLIGETIDLVIASAPSLGRVKADPGHLEQILLNLVVNSRDAMPEGGRLTIETADVEIDRGFARQHPGARPGPYVRLAVNDTGSGMTAEIRAHIFEPFFTTKGPGEGTGLGLSTVYGIVKQHDGYIAVDSEPDRGTTLTVYLPRVEAATEPDEEPAIGAGPLHRTATVLVVEDAPAVRALTRAILEQNGYTVLDAGHGHEALRICEQREGPIHLLLTDVVLPEMSGPRLAEHVRAARPETKVLYMSGYPDDTVGDEGALVPGTALIQKPFTPDSLVASVREVLGAGVGSAEISSSSEWRRDAVGVPTPDGPDQPWAETGPR